MKTPRFNVCTAMIYASLLTSGQLYAAPTPESPSSKPTSDLQKLSYTIGVKSAQELKEYNLDVDAYLSGYKDSANSSTLKLSEQEMEASINKFMEEMNAKREAEHKQMMQKSQESAATNLAAGAKFLETNKTQAGVQVTPSGLQYKIIKAGNGPKPKLGESVTVNYKGTTIDGKEFDSSFRRNASATFKLEKGGLIEGWVEALQLMPVGSSWQIVVPATLGYGDRGMPPVIEPNAVLIFEIELLNTKK